MTMPKIMVTIHHIPCKEHMKPMYSKAISNFYTYMSKTMNSVWRKETQIPTNQINEKSYKKLLRMFKVGTNFLSNN